MSYDFTLMHRYLKKAADRKGWNDKKSAKTDYEIIAPLTYFTGNLEKNAQETARLLKVVGQDLRQIL